MILNKAQAEAVYVALCALNNVGARFMGTVNFPDGVTFTSWSAGDFSVCKNAADPEMYDTPSAFASAYGLV